MVGRRLLAMMVVSAVGCGLSVTGAGSDPIRRDDAGTPPSDGGGAPGVVVEAPDAAKDSAPLGCDERGLSFDGVDDLVSVPDNAALDLNGPFTIEAWVKPSVSTTTDVTREMQILSHHNHDADEGWVFLFKDGKLELRLYGHLQATAIAGNFSSVHVQANAWTWVVGTFDGLNLRVYADGTLRDARPTAMTRSNFSGALIIGRSAYNTLFPFNGIIDEVRLSKINRYGASTTIPVPKERLPVDGETVALWHFDEQPGHLTIDNAVGAEHVGTLGSPPQAPSFIATDCIDAR